MRRQLIEPRLDPRVIVDRPRRNAEPGQERRPEPILGKKPMQIAADDPAIRTHRPLRRTRDAREGPRPVRPLGATNMDLIARHRQP